MDSWKMARRELLVASISIVVLVFYLFGIIKHLTSIGENTCEMTYMFEYPQYVRIELSDEVVEQYPRYGLYAYGEGFVIGKLRAMKFSGIPILFVPGNAGSYQQVRSLASISLRKSIKDRTPFHFDFFTVDLNEEYSAFHGGMLVEQTHFVTHCIKRVLDLYAGKIESIVLVAHSMGGIVAKGVLLDSNTTINQVNTIIMLAAPHQPVLVVDNYIAGFYEKLKKAEQLYNKSDIISISIGGGPRDVLVNTQQTIDPVADFNVVTTAIPGVWKSPDHLCILWCKEFVQTIIRALFDSVDTTKRPPQIISDKEHRLAVLNYHLLHRSGGKKMSKYQMRTEFDDNGEWIEDIRRQYTWTFRDESNDVRNKLIYLMIRLIGREDRATITATNLEHASWLFACTASSTRGHSRICKWGWNLSNKSRIFPDDARNKKKTVDLNLEDLKMQKLSHVVIRLPITGNEKRPSIGVDVHLRSDRTIKFDKRWTPFDWIFKKLGTLRSNSGQIRYEVDVGNVVNSLRVDLKSVKCKEIDHNHQATIELLEPWNHGATQLQYFSLRDLKPKTITIQTRNDLNGNAHHRKATTILRFTLDPECAYEFDVWHGGLVEYCALLARDGWQNIYGTTVALSLLALARQVDGDMGLIKSTHVTIITIALCFGLGVGLEGFVALALLYIFVACICCAVIFFGSTIYNIVHRSLAAGLRFPETWSTWIFGGLNQLPLLSTTIILSIVPVTCGGVAMFLSLAWKFLKLINCYEDYVEKLFWSSLRDGFVNKFLRKGERKHGSDGEKTETESIPDRNHVWFQLIYFIVCCIAAIPAIPSIVTWAKNYRYGVRLTTEDPYLTFCWMVLVGCDSIGLQWIPPSTPGYYSREIATVVRLLGWAALVITGGGYPHQYQYKMPLLMVTAVFLVSIRPIIGFVTA